MIKDIEGDTTQLRRLKELFTELKELFELEENLRLIEDPLDTFQHYIEEVISFSMKVPESYGEFKREIITFSENLKSLHTHIKERTNKGYIIRVYPLYRLANVLHEYERLIIQSKELGLNLPPLSYKLIKRLVPVI
ncbi:MAG: hypothetical protein ACKPFF_27870 [Planktothrix sp.]